MDILEKAIVFAVKAHSGMIRKNSPSPYILHPMEATAIAGTITADKEVLAAVMLHDTVEDTDTKISDIEREFGSRVAALVSSETENKREGTPPSESWTVRKQESLEVLKNSGDVNVKILWLSDKLSNMRAFYRAYLKEHDGLWQHFNQKDTIKQAWYYRSVAEYTKELCETNAWKEYNTLVNKIFQGAK